MTYELCNLQRCATLWGTSSLNCKWTINHLKFWQIRRRSFYCEGKPREGKYTNNRDFYPCSVKRVGDSWNPHR